MGTKYTVDNSGNLHVSGDVNAEGAVKIAGSPLSASAVWVPLSTISYGPDGGETAITSDGTNMWVVGNGSVSKVAPDGTITSFASQAAAAGFTNAYSGNPKSILWAQGNLWIVSNGPGEVAYVWSVDPSGNFTNYGAAPNTNYGGTPCFDGSKIWFGGMLHNYIVNFDVNSHTFNSFATTGNNGTLHPSNCVFDGTNIWCNDTGAGGALGQYANMYLFDTSGNLLSTYPQTGTGIAGGTLSPICFDGSSVWSISNINNTIYQFQNIAGVATLVASYPGTGSAFQYSYTLVYGNSYLWTTNNQTGDITRINPIDGSQTTYLAVDPYSPPPTPGPGVANDLAFDTSLNLWMSDSSNAKILKVSLGSFKGALTLNESVSPISGQTLTMTSTGPQFVSPSASGAGFTGSYSFFNQNFQIQTVTVVNGIITNVA